MPHRHVFLHCLIHKFDRVPEVEALARSYIQLQRHRIQPHLLCMP